MGNKAKKSRYYALRYPMNFLQEKVHKQALRKTVADLKEQDITVTQQTVLSVLKVVHLYITHLARRSGKRRDISLGTLDRVGFGYFKMIYPALFTFMHEAGEFTDEEFKIITTEFYPEEFKIYNNILNKRATWLKQKLKRKQQNQETLNQS